MSLTKQQLRKNILTERLCFVQDEYAHENEQIIESLELVLGTLHHKNNFNCKSTISTKLKIYNEEQFAHGSLTGLYLPVKGEPDLTKIMLRYNWRFALPKIIDNDLKFVHYKIGDRLVKGNFDLLEPFSDQFLAPNIIVAPALAYSIKGIRLGFGGGFYDRYFTDCQKECVKIGVCFDKYLLEYLPSEDYDIKFDYIITDKMVLKL